MSETPLFKETDAQERTYAPQQLPGAPVAQGEQTDPEDVAVADAIVPASAATVATGESVPNAGAVPQVAPAVPPATPGLDPGVADTPIDDR